MEAASSQSKHSQLAAGIRLCGREDHTMYPRNSLCSLMAGILFWFLPPLSPLFTEILKVGNGVQRGGSALSSVLIKLRVLHFLSPCKPLLSDGSLEVLVS